MPPESQPRLENQALFETSAAHCSLRVPFAHPADRVADVRGAMMGQRYATASQIIVIESGRFLGILRLEDLIAAPADAVVESIMDPDPPVVAPGVDQEIAAWRAVHHGESALCVVDEHRAVRGVIPPTKLLEVLLAEHDEDLSRLGGFLRSVSAARSTSEEPVPRRFWHRLPWLLAGLAGALVAADLVGSFESQLKQKVMIAFFLPGIVYLADAVGTQTETVVVRGLSVGVKLRRMAARELLAGLSIGAALGVLAGPLIWWRWGDGEVAVCVGLAIFAACSTATLAAMTLPWVLDAAGIDPAFGSGPLATVIQDLLSILIYLAIAIGALGN